MWTLDGKLFDIVLLMADDTLVDNTLAVLVHTHNQILMKEICTLADLARSHNAISVDDDTSVLLAYSHRFCSSVCSHTLHS